MGARLREIARQETLKIQVFSQEFALPWGLLYLADRTPQSEAEVDPEAFLGLRHIIEQIPLQNDMAVLDSAIPAAGGLKVGVNLNTDIDVEMQRPHTAEQITYWENLSQAGKTILALRKTGQAVKAALVDAASTPDQVMYFYCHAISRSLLEGEGPDASTLLLTGGQRLKLGDLYLEASPETPLPGAPLVFLNACQSAELSPLFYDGFVPYFMAKGARGVIGAECDIPALFAKEWARRFFDRFLQGEPLGEIALALRRQFYFQHHNPLGLLYALYADGDTRLAG